MSQTRAAWADSTLPVLCVALGIGLLVVAYFAWDYVKTWRLKRGYYRHLKQRTSRLGAQQRAREPLADSVPRVRAASPVDSSQFHLRNDPSPKAAVGFEKPFDEEPPRPRFLQKDAAVEARPGAPVKS